MADGPIRPKPRVRGKTLAWPSAIACSSVWHIFVGVKPAEILFSIRKPAKGEGLCIRKSGFSPVLARAKLCGGRTQLFNSFLRWGPDNRIHVRLPTRGLGSTFDRGGGVQPGGGAGSLGRNDFAFRNPRTMTPVAEPGKRANRAMCFRRFRPAAFFCELARPVRTVDV